MIDEKFIKGCEKLLRYLKKIDQAEDLDDSTLEDLGIDLGEILPWSQYCIEKFLEEITWRNKANSRINEVKSKLADLKNINPENAELLDEAIRAMEAMQWTQKNSAKIYKKEKQDLWKKAITNFYKDAKAKHDLVMGETKYIDLKILREIRDEQLGEDEK